MALVAVTALIEIGITAFAAAHRDDRGDVTAAGVALLAAGIAALPLRHRRPVAALWIAFAATLAYVSLDYPRGPIFVALIITLVQAVLTGHRRAAIAAVVAGYVGFPWLGVVIGRDEAPPLEGLLALAAWLIALLSVSEVVRSRRDRARETARWREETLRRQAADERLRIARELHDVVAHNMSLINLQAGVALHRLGDQPSPVRESLSTIKDASKEALVELRSILGVLRHVDDEAPRAPTPGLGHLAELVGRAEAAGVTVHLDIDADLDRVPRNVDLAAYRIVQESLTNVARHAQPPEALVRIRTDDGEMSVEVLDEGTGPAPLGSLPTGGNGITGMRERAASVGGHLDAGPRPGRGFAVRARLPLGDTP